MDHNFLLNVLHLVVQPLILLENVSKGIYVPFFNSSFQVFEFLLKLEHYRVVGWIKVTPPLPSESGEDQLEEPEFLKTEMTTCIFLNLSPF